MDLLYTPGKIVHSVSNASCSHLVLFVSEVVALVLNANLGDGQPLCETNTRASRLSKDHQVRHFGGESSCLRHRRWQTCVATEVAEHLSAQGYALHCFLSVAVFRKPFTCLILLILLYLEGRELTCLLKGSRSDKEVSSCVQKQQNGELSSSAVT